MRPGIALSRYPFSVPGFPCIFHESGLHPWLAGSPTHPFRIKFNLRLRTGPSPPAALHPASWRRSCSRLRAGERLPGVDLNHSDLLRLRRTSRLASGAWGALSATAPRLVSEPANLGPGSQQSHRVSAMSRALSGYQVLPGFVGVSSQRKASVPAATFATTPRKSSAHNIPRRSTLRYFRQQTIAGSVPRRKEAAVSGKATATASIPANASPMRFWRAK